MFGVSIVKNFAELFRVKDSSLFELVKNTFYERDFIFFLHLTAYLAEKFECSKKDAIEFGVLAQLLYLSSLLHFSLKEDTLDTIQLRTEKQMPVLLGDLLYGRFIATLIETGNSVHLPIYISYLKTFNVLRADDLDGKYAYGVFTMDDAAKILTEKTAEIFSLRFDDLSSDVLAEAKKYFDTKWDTVTEKTIQSIAELEALLQREFDQGAMVC